MIRPILAALFVASISLVPSQRAAADDGNRLLGLAIGAAAIYAVIEAEKRKKSRPRATRVLPTQKANRPITLRQKRCLRRKRRDGSWVEYTDSRCLARVEQRQTERALRSCERQRWGRNGWETYRDRRCLERKGLTATGQSLRQR